MAIADSDQAIALNPDDADAYTHRGLAYVSKGAFDAAIQDFTKAIALNPEHAGAYTNRGNAYAYKNAFWCGDRGL